MKSFFQRANIDNLESRKGACANEAIIDRVSDSSIHPARIRALAEHLATQFPFRSSEVLEVAAQKLLMEFAIERCESLQIYLPEIEILRYQNDILQMNDDDLRRLLS